jgi:hypothetical protein
MLMIAGVMKTSRLTAMLAALLCWAAIASAAAPSSKLTGALAGYVRDLSGVPQMGATVLLFNRYDRLVSRALTNDQGQFDFPSLSPETYSIRVSLANFVPAIKQQIAVQPGMRSVLAINLASVLSSIELIYNTASDGVMSDEWKWVLRSSMATRPILRFGPGLVDISDPAKGDRNKSTEAIFSDTRGLVKVSSGEEGPLSMLSSQQDLGTSFALATSVFGNTQVQVAGNVGYSTAAGMPAAGFRTSVSRTEGGDLGPEVNITMRQLSLPGRVGGAFNAASQDNAPLLRTMSIGVLDRVEIMDGVRLDYGASMESVQFFDRLNYVSPFARLTYDLGSAGSVELGYSSGAPPAELLAVSSPDEDAGLQRDLSALSIFPRVSLRDRRARVQRAGNYEVGYHKVSGTRRYSLGLFRETVSNATITLAAPGDFLAANEDLLPDLASAQASVFNVGSFERLGMMASVTQSLGERWNVSLGYGNGGGLTPARQDLDTPSADDLRAIMRGTRRHWALAQLNGEIPTVGTRFTTSYQWTDSNSIVPGHIYVTQRLQAPIGWNVRIHQPIRGFGLMPGRLEANAELRNLLAQGYMPISYGNGQRLLLMQAPRAVRGGLSFVF